MLFTSWQGNGIGQEQLAPGEVDATTLTSYVAQIQAEVDDLDAQIAVTTKILMAHPAEHRDALASQLVDAGVDAAVTLAAEENVNTLVTQAREAAAAKAAAATKARAEARRKRNMIIGLSVGGGILLLGGIGIAVMARKPAPAPEPEPEPMPAWAGRRRRLSSTEDGPGAWRRPRPGRLGRGARHWRAMSGCTGC